VTGSIAKITRPVLRKVTARPRLFRLVDRLARAHPVVWVSAPAGSGKTTLAASWLAARRRRSLWYQLDESDSDPASFFFHLRAAASRLAPRSETLPMLTPEYALGLATYARNFFEGLGERIPPDTVIVLDGYQELPREAPLHTLLPVALSALPAGLPVLVLSRSGPPPPFARLITEQVIGFLAARELDLDAREARALARARARKRVEAARLDALLARTDGWVAGTLLLLEAPALALPPPRTAGTPAQQVLFDYFSAEIFDRAPPETQRLLLATAILPEVSVATAEVLTDEPRAAEILADLVARNYFTVRLSGKEPRYRFHPLFRDFLQARARASFSAERLSRLRSIAAATLDGSGQWEAAARLLVEAGDWQGLARVVVAHASELLRQGRTRTLEEWLRAVPAAVLASSPWLLFWLGAAMLAVDPAQSREHFERAHWLFTEADDAAGAFLSWCGVVDTYIYAWGDFTSLDGWIAEGERLLEKHRPYPSPEIEARFTYGMFCALLYRQPQHPRFPEWETRARTVALGSADPFLRVSLSTHLIWYYSWWLGDQAQSAFVASRVRESVRSAGAGAFFELSWYSTQAGRCFFTAAHAEGAGFVAEGLRLAERSGVHLFDFTLSLLGCWCALSVEDHASAAGHLQRMAPIADTTRWGDIAMYRASLWWQALIQRDFSAALQQGQACIELMRRAGFPGGTATFLISTSVPLTELGEYGQARSALETSYAVAVEARIRTAQYGRWLYQALCALRQGDRDGAVDGMRRHLSIAREAGIQNHLGWTSSVMAELYAVALDAGIETEFVQSQIRLRKLTPPPSSFELESWPWPLQVRMLGGFELRREGRPVAFGRRLPRKPLELLQAVVALGGDHVREETLVDCLWPDAEGDAGQHAVETNLHRLRRLLGSPGALVQSDRRISLDSRCCWSDVGALRRRLTDALARLDSNRLEAAVVQRDVESVLRLYRGPFLPGLEAHWVLEARGRLRLQVARFLRLAAKQLEHLGHGGAAEGLMRRGLEADPGLGLQLRSVA
jgi:hypothetical protein